MKLRLGFVFLVLCTHHVFGAGKQLTGQHAPATSPALTPEEAQKKFKVPSPFEVRLFAAEPDVVNPVAMTWDERGRLWILELYEYPLGAPAGQKPRDRIKILEDTDNDGRADKVKVFADGLNLATGLLMGNGGVYVGQAPDLLFLEDTNGDDVADKRTVVLTGFGLHDRHELLNGFTWGPDGWLYMTHGVFTHSTVKIPEATTPGIEMTAAVARFHPQTKKFEIYADGTSNPWGVDFDKYGNAFVSACVIDHLFHMAPGGIYQRQGGLPGNPYAYELLPSIVEHKHHMAAYCGICVYQGDMFPEEYQGHVFMGNIHQNALNHDKLTPNGSSFKATAEPDFVTTSDGWFMPISEQVGPDGALWIGDWYDKYPCYQNAQADPEGVDRERGRIWRVVYNTHAPGSPIPSRPEKDMDLKKLKNRDLVKLLEHPNVWQRRTAERLLIERAQHNPARTEQGQTVMGIPDVMPALMDLVLHGKTIEARLAALWTSTASPSLGSEMKSIDGAAIEDALLNSGESALKAWNIRFLAMAARNGNPSTASNALRKIEMLASDNDPAVRLAVATACRLVVSGSLTIDSDINTKAPIGKIITKLIQSSADAKDPLIPYMIWMASEPLVAANPEPGLKWMLEHGSDSMPLTGILARKAMRRICDTGEREKMDKAVSFLTIMSETDTKLAAQALDGLLEGQKAKPLLPTVDTSALFKVLANSTSNDLKERGQQLGTLWGDAAATQKTLAAINDPKASNEDRLKAIEAAKQLKNATARDAMLKLVTEPNPEPLIIEGLRALSTIGGDTVGSELVNNWKKFTPAERTAAVDVLVSRSVWTRELLNGLEDKKISPQDISASVARTLANSKNPNFAGRASQLLGRIRDLSADKLNIIAEKRKMVLASEPNIEHGHEVAKKTCFVCHKLHGEGAEVGPDLTGVGRSTLDALLANVIDPNQIIGTGYENVFVETKDERSLSGRLIENSDTRIKLLSAGPKEETVAKSDIASMKISDSSVMPEGLEQMPETDFRDLIWYILSPPQEGALTPERRKALVGKE